MVSEVVLGTPASTRCSPAGLVINLQGFPGKLDSLPEPLVKPVRGASIFRRRIDSKNPRNITDEISWQVASQN